MELTNAREILHVRDADLTDSRFSDAKPIDTQFNDVNLQGSTFTRANLAGAQFDDVDSISAARGAVLNLRGGIDPLENEWIFQGGA